MFKKMKICPECKNKPDMVCKVCGKRRSQILFEMECLKKHEEFIKETHFLLKKFNMESTGAPTLDMEVLDCVGQWVPEIPKESPFYVYYERMKNSNVFQLFHLFKFMGVNRDEFIGRFKNYLESKQSQIRETIAKNELNFIE